ncbi:MAG TPA: hypothetical protein VGK47_02200 [Nitrososphaeraceae archaeon]
MPLDNKFVPKKSITVPPGTHTALLAEIIHIGVQRGEYKGEVSLKDQILFSFELPDITSEDGRPIRISKRETHSLGAKGNLIKLIQALTGTNNLEKGIDYSDLIGKPLLLSIEHTEKGNSKIAGYMSLPNQYKNGLKPLMSTPRLFLDVDQISEKDFKQFPEWVQKVINERVGGKNDNTVYNDAPS